MYLLFVAFMIVLFLCLFDTIYADVSKGILSVLEAP